MNLVNIVILAILVNLVILLILVNLTVLESFAFGETGDSDDAGCW